MENEKTKSPTYYQWFNCFLGEEGRYAGIMTEKQSAVLYKDIYYYFSHPDMLDCLAQDMNVPSLYLDSFNKMKQYVTVEMKIDGDDLWWSITLPYSELLHDYYINYSQKRFVDDFLDAFEDAQKDPKFSKGPSALRLDSTTMINWDIKLMRKELSNKLREDPSFFEAERLFVPEKNGGSTTIHDLDFIKEEIVFNTDLESCESLDDFETEVSSLYCYCMDNHYRQACLELFPHVELVSALIDEFSPLTISKEHFLSEKFDGKKGYSEFAKEVISQGYQLELARFSRIKSEMRQYEGEYKSLISAESENAKKKKVMLKRKYISLIDLTKKTRIQLDQIKQTGFAPSGDFDPTNDWTESDRYYFY